MPVELLEEQLVVETEKPQQRYTPKLDVPTLGRAAQGGKLSWITAIFMVAFHIGAIAALFFFSWGAVITAAILYVFATIPLISLECPALFVPVEMRQTGREGAVGWHVERSIQRSRL